LARLLNEILILYAIYYVVKKLINKIKNNNTAEIPVKKETKKEFTFSSKGNKLYAIIVIVAYIIASPIIMTYRYINTIYDGTYCYEVKIEHNSNTYTGKAEVIYETTDYSEPTDNYLSGISTKSIYDQTIFLKKLFYESNIIVNDEHNANITSLEKPYTVYTIDDDQNVKKYYVTFTGEMSSHPDINITKRPFPFTIVYSLISSFILITITIKLAKKPYKKKSIGGY